LTSPKINGCKNALGAEKNCFQVPESRSGGKRGSPKSLQSQPAEDEIMCWQTIAAKPLGKTLKKKTRGKSGGRGGLYGKNAPQV